MSQLAIDIRGLEKHYSGFDLGPVDLQVPCGSIVGFVGENGAGKSTTIRCMLDITHPDAGEARFFGQPLISPQGDMRAQIGLVLDSIHVFGSLHAQDMGRIGAKVYPLWQKDRYAALLERFQIAPKKKIKDFSRGMTMKLQMAYALSHQAKLLILDEPTSGLDPIVREEILDLLLEFVQDEQHSVLISSHILSDLEKVADYIALIHAGSMLLFEQKDSLQELYGLYACTKEQAATIQPQAIVSRRDNAYGAQLLVKRDLVAPDLPLDRPSLEDIMLMLIKGGK